MVSAAASRSSVSYVAESTYGTTPGTPSMLELRTTNPGLNMNKASLQSEERRSDRNMDDVRHGNKNPQGSIDFEWSYGAYDDIIEAALYGAWATNVLKNGVAETSFTIEQAYNDVSEFHQYSGCVVNTLSMSVRPNQMVTGSFGIIAKDLTVASSALDASVTAAASNPPFDSFTGSINEGGSSIAIATGIDWQLDNNIDPSFVLLSDTARSMVPGRANFTGTLTALFEDETLLNKYLNETESSLDFTLEGASGGDLTIDFPRVKYMGGEVRGGNTDDGIIVELPFQALYDATETSAIVITRTPA